MASSYGCLLRRQEPLQLRPWLQLCEQDISFPLAP